MKIVEDNPVDPLRAVTVGEILQRASPRWIVREFLQERTLGVVYGASQSGKTFVVLDMVVSVVRGVPWAGRRVKRGGVIYVAGEGHLQRRIEAIMQDKGVSEDDLALLRIVPSSVNLLNPSGDLIPLIAQMKIAADVIGGVVLVVLDTLNAMMPGGDENASEDMGVMVAAAKRIAADLGCTVVYIHHAGKDEARGARGHSSLKGSVDAEISVTRSDEIRAIKVEKQRDGETDITVGFKLRPVDLGPSRDPDADPDERESSCVVETFNCPTPKPAKTERRDVALDALRQVIAEHGELLPQSSTIPPRTKGVRLSHWQARFRLITGDDYKDDKVAGSAFRTARKKLIEAQKAACSGDWAWPL